MECLLLRSGGMPFQESIEMILLAEVDAVIGLERELDCTDFYRVARRT